MGTDAIGGIVTGVVIIAAVLALAAGVGTWLVWRSARRRVERWRGLWRRGALRFRSTASPWSSRGELARLRWRLLENLEKTERLLGDGVIARSLPHSLPALLPQLQRLAIALDSQLSLWEAEPDAELVQRALPALRQRVHAVVASATRMRATALDLVDEAGRLSREAAEADLRQGLNGLEAGLEAIRRLHAPPLGTGFSMPPPVDPGARSAAGVRRH